MLRELRFQWYPVSMHLISAILNVWPMTTTTGLRPALTTIWILNHRRQPVEFIAEQSEHRHGASEPNRNRNYATTANPKLHRVQLSNVTPVCHCVLFCDAHTVTYGDCGQERGLRCWFPSGHYSMRRARASGATLGKHNCATSWVYPTNQSVHSSSTDL